VQLGMKLKLHVLVQYLQVTKKVTDGTRNNHGLLAGTHILNV
jgi:hypothetical protein